MDNLERPLVVYHGDCNDGFGAALAAYLSLGDKADYVPGLYDGFVPEVLGRDVMIFDYHFKESVLVKMKEQAKSLILKDHHVSAEQIIGHLPYTYFNNEKSGAVLAWEHFFATPVPEMFLWIQDRDLFLNKYEESKYLYYYLNSKPYDIAAWLEVYNELKNPASRQKILDSGAQIHEYFKAQMSLVIKHQALPIDLMGESGWIVNAGRLFASEAGNELALRTNTFALIWAMTGKDQISCSVRSVGDSSAQAIAERFGGGGHRHAAKFTMKTSEFFNTILSLVY